MQEWKRKWKVLFSGSRDEGVEKNMEATVLGFRLRV